MQGLKGQTVLITGGASGFGAGMVARFAAEGGGSGELDGAVFFSPRSARSFVRLVTNAGQASACAGLSLFSLSPAVTEAACAARPLTICTPVEPVPMTATRLPAKS